jgi:hypothetical protein
MKLSRLAQAIKSVCFPEITTMTPAQFAGATLDPASQALALQQLAANSQTADGGVNFVTASGTTATITNLANALLQWTAGSATTLTIDYAYNICKYLTQPMFVGQKFGFNMMTNAATTIATPTLSDTAVTLAGTTSMLASALRFYNGVVTQVNTTTGCTLTAGSTFTSLTQVGTTNAYTVVLGTNAVVPVVGTAIYIGTTAGTLPAGWYPVVKVTSATSFIIATPTTGTAWTCTAATLSSSATCPSTYSPLITITGLMTVGASMAV